jgi:CelD/BcsL family acetyltransferase involved in cellulose biosynthesis
MNYSLKMNVPNRQRFSFRNCPSVRNLPVSHECRREMMSEPRLTILHPTCAADIEKLRDEWNRLGERHRSPVHQIEYAQAFIEAFFDPSEGGLKLYLVHRDGRLTALAIMRARREGRAVYFQDLGWEPTDLLYESRQDLTFLLDGIVRQGWPFRLSRLPTESIVPEVLAEHMRASLGWMVKLKRQTYPQIKLDEFPEGELNSGRRSDLRRMRRRAQRQGEVRVDFGCPPVEDVPRLFHQAIEIEAASWKLERGWALKRSDDLRRFFSNYLPRVAASGKLRMAFLTVGGRPAAVQIAEVSGGGYWLHKIGYDASLSNIAPGQLLMQDTLKICADLGLRTYELWGSAAEWTRTWTSNELASCCVEAFPLSIHSARRLGGLALRKASIRSRETLNRFRSTGRLAST